MQSGKESNGRREKQGEARAKQLGLIFFSSFLFGLTTKKNDPMSSLAA